MAVSNEADARRVERCARLCATRAWRLAAALLRDRDAAYDAVQQACLVAAAKPHAVPEDDPWPWFSVVLVHEVRNLQRKRRPLTNRLDDPGEGGPMERADARVRPPEAAAERADEAARMWAAVDALPQPEREALLLTHVGGLTHAAAAEALGVPRQTVSSRAERGIEALAQCLGREPRAAALGLAAAPLFDPAGGLAQATAQWTKAALTAHASAAGTAAAGITAAAAAGGTVMATSKAVWIAGLVLAAGAGFAGGATSGGFGLLGAEPRAETKRDAQPLVAATKDGADGTSARPRLEGGGEPAGDVVARLRAENERLVARVGVLEGEVVAARTRPAPGATAPGAGPTFTFGEAGRLEAVREADWAGLAAASREVDRAILQLYLLKLEGKPAPKELKVRLQEHTEKVRTYEYRTLDRLPTAAKHNGELTHPISVTNLIAALLAKEGRPLSAGQVADIDRLGSAFDQQFARLREGWVATMPRARRLLEEYRLKGRFMEDLYAALSAEQRALVIDPAYRGLAGLDLYDPTLMILHTSPVVAGADAGEVRADVGALLRRTLGLAPEAVSPPLDALVDAFTARALRGVEPVAPARAKHYSYAHGLQAGEAMADLVDGVLREVELTAQAREALLNDPTWFIPRLVSP